MFSEPPQRLLYTDSRVVSSFDDLLRNVIIFTHTSL